jgi:hypothetical protein
LCLKCENKNVDKIEELYIILNLKKECNSLDVSTLV